MITEWGNRYLIDRGVPLNYAAGLGVDETLPRPEIVRTRLRWKSDDSQIASTFANVASLLWFPLPDGNGEVFYNARVNGSYINQQGELQRFLFTKGGRNTVWIPKPTRDVAGDPSAPLIVIEGPFKGLATLHAGGLPLGVVGAYFNEPVGEDDKDKLNNRVLNRDIATFKLRTRPVYLAFDRDQFTNPLVRSGVIRGAIMIKVQGGLPFQLEWPSEFKGLDDFLGKGVGIDPEKQKSALGELIRKAKPFFECLVKGSGGDARLVREELWKVKMDPTDREALAGELAKPLGVTKKSLLQTEARGHGPESRRSIIFQDPEPWDQPVDGNQLLGELVALINKHVLLSADDAITIALWIMFTYLVSEPYVQVSPYLALFSPTKRCGKTRLLELIERLVWRGFLVSDISKAGFFRLIEKFHPSLLIDEAHKVLANRADLLQMFLDAYSRKKPLVIINQETHEPEAFDIWCARALAFIGDIDDQLKDRAIAISLTRKSETDVKPRLGETPYAYTEELRSKLSRWARDNAQAVGETLVPVLKSGNDRATDNWEMLFRIAAVIDPGNVESVVQIARTKETEGGDRESEEDAVLKGVQEVYREVCDHLGKTYDLPTTDIFLSLSTICFLMNDDDTKMGPWHTWRRGEKWGANEYKLSKIVRTYSPGDSDRSREEPNLRSMISNWQTPSSDVRGFWLHRLRQVFERYK